MVGIHASELKLWHFEVFHVCIGKPYMHICNDLHLYWDVSQCLYREASANALIRWAWPRAHVNVKTFTRFPQIAI